MLNFLSTVQSNSYTFYSKCFSSSSLATRKLSLTASGLPYSARQSIRTNSSLVNHKYFLNSSMSSRERSRSRSRSPRAGGRRYFNDSAGNGPGDQSSSEQTLRSARSGDLPSKQTSNRSFGSFGSSSSLGLNQGLLKKNLANKYFGYLARCEFWAKIGLRFWILVG